MAQAVKNLPAIQEIRVQSPGAFQVVLVVKNPLTNAGDIKDCLFDPWGWEDPLEEGIGESYGQRSLEGYRGSIG